MPNINKGIILTAYIEYGTFYLLYHVYWFKLLYVEVCYLFLPDVLLDVILDAINYSVDEEAWEDRHVFIA